ncbi:MAG: hypothetical protein ACP5O6_10020, partial [Candidatus Baltobacteraceae bacterium]
PQYVSAKTKSVVITLASVNGTAPSPAIPPTIFNIAVPPCTAVTGGISCDVTVGAILGSDVFTIVARDAANGTGNILSTGSITVVVGPGTNTPPPVALGGNVATVVVTAPPSASPLPNGDLSPSIDGSVNTIQVTVAAYDADHNLIVGSAPFASPIPVVLTGDPYGALTVSPTSVLAPNQNVVTLGTSGKLFYSTPSPTNPNPTLQTASITFGPSGANGTTFTIDPLQIDLPSGGLTSILPAPSTTSIGLQQAGATSFTIGASFSGSTSTQSPFAGGCGASLTGSPAALPLTCSTTSGSTEISLMSLAGGTGSISIATSVGANHGVAFNALGSQGGGGATLGYTVVLWDMPNHGSAPNQDIPTSMALGPSGQHLWVTALNASSGSSVTALPAQNLTTCTAASSPCNATNAHQATLPQATYAPAPYTPAPSSIVLGGDGNMWYEDLGTNSLTNQTLGYFSASACIVATACAIPNSFGAGPGTTSVQIFSSSPEALADGGDGNIYMLFGNTSGGGAVSAAPYSGFSPSIYGPESLTSLAPGVTSPIAEGIVRGPDGAMWMTVDGPPSPSGPTSAIVEFSHCISGVSFLCATTANTQNFPENESASPAVGPYHPGEIASVPAANDLWFINRGSTTSPIVAPFIASISSAAATYGAFGPRIPIPNAAAVSGTIALGPDGNLWFPITTTTGTQQICRYTIVASASGPSFYCVTIPPVAGTSYPAGPMAIGPDGNLWFGLVGAPYVGEVIP